MRASRTRGGTYGSGRRRRRFTTGWILVGLILACRLSVGSAHSFHVDHTDAELAEMDTESLLHVETDLRAQNKVVDKRIASINGRLSKILEQQKEDEADFRRLESGREWEERQIARKDQELAMAQAEMEAKKEQVKALSEHSHKLREDIHDMEQKLQEMQYAKQLDEKRYKEPTLLDVVESEYEILGETQKQIVNKTLHAVFLPMVITGSDRAKHIRSQLRESTQKAALVSTFTIYLFLVALLVIVVRAYRRIRGMITLTRMLFTADLCFASFWMFITIWYMGLLQDPLVIMLAHHERVFTAFQFSQGVTLAWYLFIRCVSLAASFSLVEAGELIASLSVVQHYYQTAWAPSMTDQPFHGNAGTYAVYAVTHLLLAARRARAHVRGYDEANEKLRGLGGAGSAMEDPDASLGSWVWQQLRQVALLVEALLFAVSPRTAAQTVGEREETEYASSVGSESYIQESESRVLFRADSSYSEYSVAGRYHQ